MPVDIIVLAAVVVFILLRLYGILGQKIGHDQSQAPRDSSFDKGGKVIELTPKDIESVRDPVKERDKEEEHLDDSLRDGLAAIRKDDANFTPKEFLNGAKAAFEMVLNAFAKDDRDTLKALLSKDIYNEFLNELKLRKTQDSYTETTLVSILKADITDIEVENRHAQVTVAFESEQIQSERYKDGDTVKESNSAIELVDDIWVFKRDLRSPNPNWTVIDT